MLKEPLDRLVEQVAAIGRPPAIVGDAPDRGRVGRRRATHRICGRGAGSWHGQRPARASRRASSSARTSGRRCWRSVGASALRLAIAALISTTAPRGPPDRGGLGARARDGPREDRVASLEQPPDLLVGLDPGRRGAGIAEHPVGHRPVAGGRVVDEGQALALVGQLVELALRHRLPELALDEALPRRGDLAVALGVEARCGAAFMLRHRSNDSGAGPSAARRRYESVGAGLAIRPPRWLWSAGTGAGSKGAGLAVAIKVVGQAAKRGLIPRIPAPDKLVEDARTWVAAEYPQHLRSARVVQASADLPRAVARPPPGRRAGDGRRRRGGTGHRLGRHRETVGPATTRSWAGCSTASGSTSTSSGRTSTTPARSARRPRGSAPSSRSPSARPSRPTTSRCWPGSSSAPSSSGASASPASASACDRGPGSSSTGPSARRSGPATTPGSDVPPRTPGPRRTSGPGGST